VPSLLPYLPPVRGQIQENVPLDKRTSLQVGGCAEVLFTPQDSDDLIYFLRKRPRAVPVTVLGAGTNVLIRDGGIPGIVIHLGKGFERIFKEGNTFEVGAGVIAATFAEQAAYEGVSGFEFLSTLPGTMGGGICANAGCFGRSFKDILLEMEAVDFCGRIHWVSAKKLGLTYRASTIPKDWILVRAWVCGQILPSPLILKTMEEYRATRAATQPTQAQTAGSLFKNPEGKAAWELIDAVGLRGTRLGEAEISEKHANFLINTGHATASDLETLGEKVCEKVLQETGVSLSWEIVRLGVPFPEETAWEERIQEKKGASS
jgi:UDP-N-acetylmuramate dehydrogenase